MHTYDIPRRPTFQQVPSARPARDPHGGPSATPIFDALYAEYVKSFRSLPGDRSGEDGLGFTAFGNMPYGSGGSSYPAPRPGSFSSSYSAYSAGAQSARLGHAGQWQRVGPLAQLEQASRQQTPAGTHHVPAALPPAPRRSQ